MRYLFLILTIFLVSCGAPEIKNVSPKDIPIIPKVSKLGIDFGTFDFDETTTIYYSPEFVSEAEIFRNQFRNLTGLELNWDVYDGFEPKPNSITLSNESTPNKEFGFEHYTLSVQPKGIIVSAYSGIGAFHGTQSLLQLLPNEPENHSIQNLWIEDYPQFVHRGLLLDCCRHFWSVDVVKKYIDLLAYYKMNVLHWHLTEDQGWRIEIKKYPKLTEVGAWRTEEDGSRYGGFYTQEEIKEVVDYASARHVTVIPEIELPGHSLAALASYPHLACTDGPFEVTPEWGVFKDVYCAGNDSTFMFLEDVLSEVMRLFPSSYIHIGGDESPKYRWENCAKCQKRITENGLHDEHELQSYFIKRIENFLNDNDRKLIGWDEILEGGLAEGATVQSWRGMQGGIDAVSSGNYAIMSPISHCYLDYGLELIDLEKIYNFDPIPAELNEESAKQIIGGECNMWTEHVPDEASLDSKVFPRMIGLAEVLWSYPEDRDFREFSNRLEKHYPRLEKWGVNYGFEKIPIGFVTGIQENCIKVSVEKAKNDLQIKVDFGNGKQDWISDSTFTQSQDLIFTASQNGKEFSKEFPLKLSVHEGLGKEPSINAEFSLSYTAGGKMGLSDGVRGTLDFRDGGWQGYQVQQPLEVVVDLGETKSISNCTSNFYQYNNAWIFAPTKVDFSVSVDGQSFELIGSAQPQSNPKEKGQFIETLEVSLGQPVEARFVKMKIHSIGPCPNWHDAAGSDSWIFVDEFVIQ
ncbi:family 20 glycosylhydrolase [Flavobacteriales bacterium]|nr:family 20 glycosylhydrolase [Flavobacteriales bacterium]